MAALYRKKPVIVEAVRWDGTVSAATMAIGWILANGGTARYHDDPAPALSIDTLEGTMAAAPGDWIIKGIQGVYPCKPGIFAATYELVTDVASDEDRIRDAMAEAQAHPGRTITR